MRRLRLAFIFLVIGAAHVVLVAWGCALFSATPILRYLEGDPDWPIAVADGWPTRPRVAFAGESAGYRMRGAQTFARRSTPGPGPRRIIDKRIELHDFGWPRSMRRVRVDSPPVEFHRAALAVPILDPIARGRGRMLPLRPLWPGFAVGTVLYAMIACVLLEGPGQLRRARRAWSGRCVGCGYDLRGKQGAVCPECGRRI